MKVFKISSLFAVSALAINVVTLYNSLPVEAQEKVKARLNELVGHAKVGAYKASEVYHSEVSILKEEIEELKAELEKYRAKFVSDLEEAKSKFLAEMEKADAEYQRVVSREEARESAEAAFSDEEPADSDPDDETEVDSHFS